MRKGATWRTYIRCLTWSPKLTNEMPIKLMSPVFRERLVSELTTVSSCRVIWEWKISSRMYYPMSSIWSTRRSVPSTPSWWNSLSEMIFRPQLRSWCFSISNWWPKGKIKRKTPLNGVLMCLPSSRLAKLKLTTRVQRCRIRRWAWSSKTMRLSSKACCVGL